MIFTTRMPGKVKFKVPGVLLQDMIIVTLNDIVILGYLDYRCCYFICVVVIYHHIIACYKKKSHANHSNCLVCVCERERE